MKKLTSLYIVFLLTMLSFQGNLKAQVSHGGRPLPLSLMRSTNGQMFKEMPPFDVQEELRIDSLNESDLRSGFRFAYGLQSVQLGRNFHRAGWDTCMETRDLLARGPFHQRALHGI